MLSSMDTICVVLRNDALSSVKEDPDFGEKLFDAVREYEDTRRPVAIRSERCYRSQRPGVVLRVVGSDSPDKSQCYVIHGSEGEHVTSEKASQEALDAMVDVLRGHGYTCRRTSTQGDGGAA